MCVRLPVSLPTAPEHTLTYRPAPPHPRGGWISPSFVTPELTVYVHTDTALTPQHAGNNAYLALQCRNPMLLY